MYIAVCLIDASPQTIHFLSIPFQPHKKYRLSPAQKITTQMHVELPGPSPGPDKLL
jgi:hypothetical protein